MIGFQSYQGNEGLHQSLNDTVKDLSALRRKNVGSLCLGRHIRRATNKLADLRDGRRMKWPTIEKGQ